MPPIEWSTLIPAAFVFASTIIVGRWAYTKLPKKDMGAAALATVQAAREAVALNDQVTNQRLEQLEERVGRLEEIIVEKDQKLEKSYAKIELLEKECSLLLRWIAALSEQVTLAGKVPISLDEIQGRDKKEE
jgi:hypothetical protein